jgi:hypothetical protein
MTVGDVKRALAALGVHVRPRPPNTAPAAV